MSTINIKTISQLPETKKLYDGNLFETSQLESTTSKTFSSKSVTYATLKNQLYNTFQSKIESAYGLTDTVKVTDINNQVKTLQNGNATINGTKTFKSIPQISKTFQPADIKGSGASNNIPNVGAVYQIMQDCNGFISPTDIIDDDPNNEGGGNVNASDEFMYWHIDHNRRDSNDFDYSMNGAYDRQKDIACKHSGNLVMWGWLADNGDVRPENAWVGLYAKLPHIDTTGSGRDTVSWKLIALQPWIIGTKSQTLQYVGFNVPVSIGLQLKVMTGFNVNGNNSGLQGENTMTIGVNEPNTFMGYIIHSTNN